MAISKGFRYKDKEGKVTDYEYGVNGSNVTQDSEHRLVTDEEKQTWNDKADLEDIPSGSAASHAVANNCTTTAAGSVLDARQGKVLMDKANQLSSDLDGFSFHTDENGHYLQKGGEMYLLQNKPFEISAWCYQINGGKTELILDSEDYKTLSIGQQDGNGALSIYGKGSSETAISQGSDGYYNVSAYNQIVIRITNNTYVTGTLNSIRLW